MFLFSLRMPCAQQFDIGHYVLYPLITELKMLKLTGYVNDKIKTVSGHQEIHIRIAPSPTYLNFNVMLTSGLAAASRGSAITLADVFLFTK